MKQDKGVIYIATSERHLQEAICSAESVKTCMPRIPITLFTDRPGISNSRFHSVYHLPSPTHDFSDKILPLLDTPYERSLFLDTDTYMCENCEDVFLLLDRHDILAVQDPWRNDFAFEKVPHCFPTLNTGVIAYRKCPAVDAFIRNWHQHHSDHFGKLAATDQPAFRHALYHSNLNLFVLPTEYNLRTYYPCFIGGHARVRIIHDRNRYTKSIVRELNRKTTPRIYGNISIRLALLYYAQKTANVSRRLARKWFLPNKTGR